MFTDPKKDQINPEKELPVRLYGKLAATVAGLESEYAQDHDFTDYLERFLSLGDSEQKAVHQLITSGEDESIDKGWKMLDPETIGNLNGYNRFLVIGLPELPIKEYSIGHYLKQISGILEKALRSDTIKTSETEDCLSELKYQHGEGGFAGLEAALETALRRGLDVDQDILEDCSAAYLHDQTNSDEYFDLMADDMDKLDGPIELSPGQFDDLLAYLFLYDATVSVALKELGISTNA